MLTREIGIEVLDKSGKKRTAQRVAIIDSLVNYGSRREHPTAEQIFDELRVKPENRSLSIATVYSTTQLLSQEGAIRILTIDDKRVVFDAEVTSHAHFMCHTCKRIMNVPIGCKNDGTMPFTGALECRRKMNVPVNQTCLCIGDYRSIPEISEVTNAEILLYGVCANCATGAGSDRKG